MSKPSLKQSFSPDFYRDQYLKDREDERLKNSYTRKRKEKRKNRVKQEKPSLIAAVMEIIKKKR